MKRHTEVVNQLAFIDKTEWLILDCVITLRSGAADEMASAPKTDILLFPSEKQVAHEHLSNSVFGLLKGDLALGTRENMEAQRSSTKRKNSAHLHTSGDYHDRLLLQHKTIGFGLQRTCRDLKGPEWRLDEIAQRAYRTRQRNFLVSLGSISLNLWTC